MRMETRYLKNSPQLKPEDKKEMTSSKFIKFSKAAVKKNYSNMDDESIHLVWFSKSLKNFKGLFITDAMDSKMYEVTYNGEKNEIYVDTYVKRENKVYDVNM